MTSLASIALMICQTRNGIDGALASAEALAEHGIVTSLGFERMIEFLMQAQEAASSLETEMDKVLRAQGVRSCDMSETRITAVAQRVLEAANEDGEA